MNQGFRKHSTVLFTEKDRYQSRKWSGLLPNHTNLTNHQLCIVSSNVMTGGVFHIHIIPDGRNGGSVDTGLTVDMAGKDSAIVSFTGVLSGLRIFSSDPITPDASISAVFSSYARQRETKGRATASDENYDYVTSELAKDTPSGFVRFSKDTPNHSNMIYHQLSLIANTPISDEYRLRIIPDTDTALERSADTGKIISFNGSKSVMVRFGGVLRGVHLEALNVTSSGVPMTIVMSSSLERFDEITYDYIGDPPSVSGLSDHLNDFDNPHQTTWNNLLNKPVLNYPFVKEVLPLGETLIIPTLHQLLVWEQFDIEGDLTIEGTLVVLGDWPEAPPEEPSFTYFGGDLSQIDYVGGEQKIFVYNMSGDLERLDYIADGVTLRKEFFYTGGGDLDYITEQYL